MSEGTYELYMALRMRDADSLGVQETERLLAYISTYCSAAKATFQILSTNSSEVPVGKDTGDAELSHTDSGRGSYRDNMMQPAQGPLI
jgi:hypothetical protein